MIRSGISSVDAALDGGIRDGLVTDVSGPPASGKTQFALQVCVNAITEDRQVIFFDTRGEFRPERIVEILESRGRDARLLAKITVLRATNTSEQIAGLGRIEPRYSLAVIDGATELFSFEYGRADQSLMRTRAFRRYMHELAWTAFRKNVPAVITNPMTVQDENAKWTERTVSPFAHVRIQLARKSGCFRGALRTVNRRASFSFAVTGAGIEERAE